MSQIRAWFGCWYQHRVVTLMYTISWSVDPGFSGSESVDPGFSRHYSYLACQHALRPALKSSTCRAIYGPPHRINDIQDCARNKIFFCDVMKNLVRGGMSFDETLPKQKSSSRCSPHLERDFISCKDFLKSNIRLLQFHLFFKIECHD